MPRRSRPRAVAQAKAADVTSVSGLQNRSHKRRAAALLRELLFAVNLVRFRARCSFAWPPYGAAMFIDQLREAVEAAHTLSDISGLERTIWRAAWPNYVNDADAQELAQVLHNKKRKFTSSVNSAARPIGFAKPKARITGPKKAAAIARRRRLASCWPLPPHLTSHFTTCELAALRVIADDMKRHGVCTMFNDKIAAIAGTCRTIVKSALRKARALRLLTVDERRRAGQRSLTNVVRFLCTAWKQWILRKPIGVRFSITTDQTFRTNGATAAVERFGSGLARVGIAKTGPPWPAQ